MPKRTACGLSFSGRRQFFTMLWEVGQRDGLSEDELAAAAAELGDTADPGAAVRRRRYPMLSSLEERLERITTETLAGSGVRLSAPPYFEGARFSVELSFASQAELRRRIAALQKLEERADELFELL